MGGKKVYELDLEVGHRSSPLSKKLLNGYTHKWTVFVKGVNNSKIENCIQRVVFQLHESFENPFRDISEPPYQVKETGYAGFEIPIQVYFKNKDKPNHVVYIHDLSLLQNKPNDSSKTEKLKFINPNKEFEKCLIKSGAQLVSVAVKKERSDSPPAKKQKSSSLIPSKDMSKQPPQPQTQPKPQHQHHNHHSSHHHQKSSSQTQNNHNSNSSSSNNHHHHNHTSSTKQHSSHNNHNNDHRQHNNNHHHQNHQQQNHHPPSSQHQQQSLGRPQQPPSQQQQLQPGQKPKSSGAFIDLFGAPLVYNPNSKHPHKHHNNNKHSKYDNISSSKYDLIKEEPPARTPPPPPPPVPQQQQQKHSPPPPPPPSIPIAAPVATPVPVANPIPTPVATPVVAATVVTTKEDQYANDLQMIQTKISCLSDCDRLQKIVDIVEEAGEWFNLTSKKFEFDLKRLDRKTLSKIERCLQH